MKPTTKVPAAKQKRAGEAQAKRLEALRKELDHKVEFIPPNKLIPYERNPLKHPADQIDQIVNSIREFGFTVPILIDEKNMVLAGHGRHMAALKMEMARVPIIRRSGLTEAQKRAYVIADNKITMNAVFDWQLITGELEALKELDFNLDLTGFRPFEYDMLLQADWTPPDKDKTRHSGEMDLVMIEVTHDEKAIIDRAILKCRTDSGDSEMTDGAALEHICAAYLDQ